MDDNHPRTGEEAVRAALARLAPAELPYLDPVLRSYRLDPWTADGDDDGSDRPVGAGIPIDQLAAWTPLVLGFVAQVIAGAAVEGAAHGAASAARSRLATWSARRRRRKALAGALSAPVPAFDDAQRRYLRTLAVRAAAARGRPPVEQEEFAAAVMEVLADDTATAGGSDGQG